MSNLSTYLKQIQSAFAAGNATEHTHRPALKTLLESISPGVVATNEPKRTKCGAPDFILTRGQSPLGYVEAKDIGKSLDAVQSDEQLKRYRESLVNLILTDYLEFRWYVGGQFRLTARLASVVGDKIIPVSGGAEQVSTLLTDFLQTTAPTVSSPRDLAERMAHLARLICEIILRAVTDEEKTGSLHQQMDGFRNTLLRELTEAQFADMYAQTIAYGLFAARCNASGSIHFTRQHAAFDLPKTNPFLRKMFSHIAGIDLDDRIVWAVDDLADLLARADMAAILADFGSKIRQEDPVVHFYETFLAAYDPKMREARGVYYTPEPVVSYLVRSVDHILKTDFNLPQGLANASKVNVEVSKSREGIAKIGTETRAVHKVQILDPATGTGTFLYGIINKIYESFATNKGMWPGYVREHLLPRLTGFELLMAPYAVAHLKLGLLLAETGYTFDTEERLRVYLTNSLEEADVYAGRNIFAQWLADEANAASLVKRDTPVMVVIGNPPYSVSSQNRNDFISGLIADYKRDLHEKKINLDDDFIKFVRFAQWRIERTGQGVLAFITNNSFIDGLTHRQMRRSLLTTFDDIYILNLHGNSRKRETCPDGTKDQNVFDIMQGVAISLFVKRPEARGKPAVRYADVWGPREAKYEWLRTSDVSTTVWNPTEADKPYWYFVPKDLKFTEEYSLGRSLADFAQGISGIETKRDHFAIDFELSALQARISDFIKGEYTDEQRKDIFKVRDNEWSVSEAVQTLRQDNSWESEFVRCLSRPFDLRWIIYNDTILSRDRGPIMQGMNRPNLAMIAARQSKEPFAVLASRTVATHKIVTVYDRSFLFPLYRYDDTDTNLFEQEPATTERTRSCNLSAEFIVDFSAKLRMEFLPDGMGDRHQTLGPEDVYHYMYAVFNSPAYKSRYEEFLKSDFPRLPLTSNADLFRSLCKLGSRLVALHLMEATGTDLPQFPIAGTYTVDAVRYEEAGGKARGRVWINKQQYFEPVPPEVWNYHIGGYQVADKWLKDRKGRRLTYDDLQHYQKVIGALAETIKLMLQIDEVIEEHGGWPIR